MSEFVQSLRRYHNKLLEQEQKEQINASSPIPRPTVTIETLSKELEIQNTLPSDYPHLIECESDYSK